MPGRGCMSINLIEANPVPEQHKDPVSSSCPRESAGAHETRRRTSEWGPSFDAVLYWECGFRHVGIGGGRASRQQLLIFFESSMDPG